MALINIFKKQAKKPAKPLKAEKAESQGEEVQKKSPGNLRSASLPVGKYQIAGSETVLLRPHVTEKAGLLADHGQYVFEVAQGGTKHQVRSAVEQTYGIHVRKVTILALREKQKRDRKGGKMRLRTHARKKAIVTLQKGEKIEILPR